MMNVLTIDVGGTHVKVLATDQSTERKIASGPHLTAQRMVDAVKNLTADWAYDVVSIGYPGPVVHNVPFKEPANLGSDWVNFDYRAAFGRPTKIINDAAMQALGSYAGGRMLFLGLGTGLGSAMIVDGQLQPMELAHLPYSAKQTYEDCVGLRGLKRLGKKKWRKQVAAVVEELCNALQPDYVVLGGGNARLLKELPPNARLGDNANAFEGGFRLWRGVPTEPASSMLVSGVHALIFSPEADGVRAFLRDVLGLSAVDAGGGWPIFALPPAELGVHPAEGGTHHELYLMCEDIEHTMQQLQEKGVEFTNQITDAGFGRLTSMRIPGGAELALYQPRHATAIGRQQK